MDEFAEFFDGPLSLEEQELIKQLKARESEVERIFKQNSAESPKKSSDPLEVGGASPENFRENKVESIQQRQYFEDDDDSDEDAFDV